MTIRAFLAADVDPAMHAVLVDVKRELQETGAAVRWVRDEGLHATVKFLGSVFEAALPAIHDALLEALADTPRITAAVHGIGAFPSAARPRVVWIGLDCPALCDVAAAVDRALEPLGFTAESRPFRPHITLGRVTGSARAARMRTALHARRDERFGSCAITELIGYRSDLRRGGAVYTKLWTIPFGG